MKKQISFEELMKIVRLVSGGIGDVGLNAIETEFNKLKKAR